jgi:hypothetical protein
MRLTASLINILSSGTLACVMASGALSAAETATPVARPSASVEQILSRHLAARGGLQ